MLELELVALEPRTVRRKASTTLQHVHLKGFNSRPAPYNAHIIIKAGEDRFSKEYGHMRVCVWLGMEHASCTP
jgi:hypothetical protein